MEDGRRRRAYRRIVAEPLIQVGTVLDRLDISGRDKLLLRRCRITSLRVGQMEVQSLDGQQVMSFPGRECEARSEGRPYSTTSTSRPLHSGGPGGRFRREEAPAGHSRGKHRNHGRREGAPRRPRGTRAPGRPGVGVRDRWLESSAPKPSTRCSAPWRSYSGVPCTSAETCSDTCRKSARPSIKRALDEAWNAKDATRAQRLLENLARSLEGPHPGTATSLREGLEDTLPGLRIGVKGTLLQSLRSTNAIESLNDKIASYTRRVKRWQGGKRILR